LQRAILRFGHDTIDRVRSAALVMLLFDLGPVLTQLFIILTFLCLLGSETMASQDAEDPVGVLRIHLTSLSRVKTPR